jgi:DNA-binding response OmpR family regulator
MTAGRTVLIVEDEALVAMDFEQQFIEWNWKVLGAVGNMDRAFALLDSARPDLAVLDMNIGADTSFELARRLRAGDTAVIFVSGRDAEDVPDDLRDCACLNKPVDYRQLELIVAAI